MASGFKLKSVSANELSDLVKQQTPRGRTSKAQELVEEFLSSGQTAATIDCGDAKDRNALSISASNFTRRTGNKIWIKKSGPTSLLLINLSKAPANVVKAYEGRPLVGRRPAKKR